MLKTLFRCILALIVLVNLTGAVLCMDTECAAERENCTDHHKAETCCTEEEPQHDADHPADEHCSSCPQCSVSVIVLNQIEERHIGSQPLAEPVSDDDIHSGWVSLLERPPSA